MDIAELSRKMEATPLGTCSNSSFCLKSLTDESFSPRLTRSKTNLSENCLKNETKVSTVSKKGKINEVEKFYLSKKSKVAHKNLETIYEDPVCKKGSTMLIGTAKVKRSIYLDREFRITSKQKSKLRKMKIKRLGQKAKHFKMSDEEFKNQMLRIENYINEDDVKCSDVEFDNCDNIDVENANSESSMGNSESKDLEMNSYQNDK